MTPNCAIIRWTDETFAQLEWSDGRFRATEFATLEKDDSYNELNYNQMVFAVLNPETNTSQALDSFTIQNEEGTELRNVAPQDMWEMIEYLLVEHFSEDEDEQESD